MKKKLLINYLIVFILTFLDQITKYLVVSFFNVNEYIIIIKNFLKFYYIKNIGASFGFLSGNTILIIFITLIIIFYILYEMNKNKNNRLFDVSCILILSGAFGNLIDRVCRGYVVDFISFTLFNTEMAIFNVADIFITFGVILYIIILIMEGKKNGNSSKRGR